jgi:hypothetical protein
LNQIATKEGGRMQAGTAENEEALKEMRGVLKQLDPLLDVRWFPYVRVAQNGALEGRYALICQWPQADRRWEMYHNGDIGEPFDILGYYEVVGDEMDWHSGGLSEGSRALMDPSSVMEKTMELLGKMDNSRHSWRDRLRKSAQHNKDLMEKRKAEVLDETLEGFKHFRKKVQGSPIVSVARDVPAS